MLNLEVKVPAAPVVKKYIGRIQKEVLKQYKVAEAAKATGKDTSEKIEMVPAVDLADRSETLIGLPGLAKRYREVLPTCGGDRRKTYFQLFREIMEQKWSNIPDDAKRLEIAIKACLLIETEGVVVAPLDGLPKIEINKNPDGSKYVDIYFAGPIRAAGGSSTVIPLILGDYGRQLLGLDKYKPTEDEVERYVEEIGIYQTEIISRQYKIPDDEIRIIVKNCPVCVNGTPTELEEVSVHRDLARIPTNRIRGGVGLVVSEGLALKAMWVMDKAKKLANLDWTFLEKIVKVEKTQTKIEIKPNKKILDGLAAGRPILAYPSRWGGFRLRYGRGRNTGIMAKAINPAGMIMFDEFIAVGTHGKIERPGKATQFFPCNTIDGPIVLLKDGEVLHVDSVEKAESIKPNLEKILYIGDLLASYGDFRKSAHPLIPPGYCEEWWVLELEQLVEKKPALLKELKLEHVLTDPRKVSEDEAMLLCEKVGVSLHPKYLHYYLGLNNKEIIMLHNFLLSAELKEDKIILTKDFEAKIFLERIGLPHKIEKEKIIIDDYAKTIIKTFSLIDKKKSKEEDVLKYLCEISGISIRDKAGSFIGARMGRPEQAKRREMKGNPHVLFPIGLKGGSTKSINKAIDMNNNEKGKVKLEIAEYFCTKCKKKTFSPVCHECGTRTKLMRFCRGCEESFAAERCPKCGKETMARGMHEVDVRTDLARAKANLRVPLPSLIKGVKGMISDAKEAEPLEKGILRARHNVHIFRDGTSRYELLNATMTHFKPKEINLTIEKIKELGYETDYHGKEITSTEQLIELFPQDIIVNDDCGSWMLEVSHFVDDELEKFYGKEKFYNAKTKEDLIGALLLGLAPHTSAGVTSRVIGYTKARLGFGHPYWVCAKRRNVDGDQDSVLMLMDGLLNFSLKYLANRNGGKMDAPIVFSTVVNPREVDDEVYNMEIVFKYPLSFYEKASTTCDAFIDDIKIVNDVIDTKEQYTNIGFTHETEIFDEGPKKSRYVQLKSMEEKINRQNALQKKIAAVDPKDCLERVMGSHFMPDIIGNARAFSRQSFRCTHCNEKYRRIPLSGKCYKCGRDNVILTIHQGSVRKYLKIAQKLAREEHLSDYLIQRLDMVEKEIDSVFNNEKVQQKGLFDFV